MTLLPSINPAQRPLGLGSARAFSLIEVVLAISIVAFSLLAIVGTLPVGVQSMRDSQNDQAVGTIANQIRGDLQQISFNTTNIANIQTLSSATYYYTTEGLKTDTTGTDGPAYYQANFYVTNAAVNGTNFAGSVNAPSNAAQVTVNLSYPYPVLSQSTSFNLFAARQGP